jgi:hypothetical protein
LSNELTLHQLRLLYYQPLMGVQSNKYTTTTVGIIRIAGTVDITRIELITMVIGIIIETRANNAPTSTPA